jgi:hypothetical protein
MRQTCDIIIDHPSSFAFKLGGGDERWQKHDMLIYQNGMKPEVGHDQREMRTQLPIYHSLPL